MRFPCDSNVSSMWIQCEFDVSLILFFVFSILLISCKLVLSVSHGIHIGFTPNSHRTHMDSHRTHMGSYRTRIQLIGSIVTWVRSDFFWRLHIGALICHPSGSHRTHIGRPIARSNGRSNGRSQDGLVRRIRSNVGTVRRIWDGFPFIIWRRGSRAPPQQGEAEEEPEEIFSWEALATATRRPSPAPAASPRPLARTNERTIYWLNTSLRKLRLTFFNLRSSLTPLKLS